MRTLLALSMLASLATSQFSLGPWLQAQTAPGNLSHTAALRAVQDAETGVMEAAEAIDALHAWSRSPLCGTRLKELEVTCAPLLVKAREDLKRHLLAYRIALVKLSRTTPPACGEPIRSVPTRFSGKERQAWWCHGWPAFQERESRRSGGRPSL